MHFHSNQSMYLLLLYKNMSGVLNKQFITTEIRRKVIAKEHTMSTGEFNDLVIYIYIDDRIVYRSFPN